MRPFIILDCERMRHAHTGLYHFCRHLAKEVYKCLPAPYKMGIYLPQKAHLDIDAAVPVLQQHFWHKYIMKAARGVDLWHSTYQGTNYFPKAGRCKIVLTVHDLNFLYDERKSAAKKETYLRSLEAKLQRADAVVAISEYVKQDLLSHTAVQPDKLSVIYNGCNIDDSIVPQAPAVLPKAPFFFTIGTIVDKKNFHVLPRMLLHNNYHLFIAGIVQSEAYKQKIIAEARALGVAHRLVFTGPVSEAEKYWYLQHCGALVFPSLSEGFGLPVIEAMYFGKPVVLSKATSLPEVGGTHAYYFDNFDAAHMSQVALSAIDDVQMHSKAGAIKQWALRFRWEEAAKAYINIYQTLLQ